MRYYKDTRITTTTAIIEPDKITLLVTLSSMEITLPGEVSTY